MPAVAVDPLPFAVPLVPVAPVVVPVPALPPGRAVFDAPADVDGPDAAPFTAVSGTHGVTVLPLVPGWVVGAPGVGVVFG